MAEVITPHRSSAPTDPARDRPAPSLRAVIAADLIVTLVVVALAALGVWQLQRRTWKLDLIQRVETRVHAPPVALPPQSRWAQVSAATDEYRHVMAKGVFLPVRPALVQAVTALGGGFWVMAPLRSEDGAVVLVNRGFVSADQREATLARAQPPGLAQVTGLLRMSEPGGAFLRNNDPIHDRWYSRDVEAIAAARSLPPVAPFFIDQEETSGNAGEPVAGLTVIHFPNNHLLYALTWFAMAFLLTGATARANRQLLRRRGAATHEA